MEDTDLFARIYPVLNIGNPALKAIEASALYVAPQLLPPKAIHSRSDRESTRSPEPLNGPELSAYHYLPCLELRFSRAPPTSRGFVFGCGPTSDVVLDNIPGISHHHFSLTFDQERRLIVRDWGSLVGTEVTYDGEGGGLRSNFQWIVGGHRVPKKKKSIIVTAHTMISFQIVAFCYDVKNQAYIDSVNRFCRGTAMAEDLLDHLNLPDRETERPTSAHTPIQEAIHLRKRLGQGSFGVVTHSWNVSDGSEYALKEPPAKAIRKQTINVDAWTREAGIMKPLSHDHIVKLYEYFLTPYPRLHLEYMPEGSLDDQQNVSADEALSILRQCLSALTYLHGQQPPIVHRDIKPGNILVQHRFPGDIHVKFGDFGLSRDSCDLSTICGSRPYLAPEVYQSLQHVNSGGTQRRSYTPAVDIWSLGVVVYELMCQLPKYTEDYVFGGTTWCTKVINGFERDRKQRPSELRQFLLSAMVVLSPQSRCSARDCHAQATLLSEATEDGCQTPTPSTTGSQAELPTLRSSPETYIAKDRASMPWPRSIMDSHATGSSDAGRYIRSDAPPPPTLSLAFGASQKTTSVRKTHRLSWSSSAERRTKRRQSHSQSESASQDQPELAHFLDDYSQNPLNSLYVGSALASQARQDVSSSWARQSLHGLTPQTQPGTDAETVGGSGRDPAQGRSSAPRIDDDNGHCAEGDASSGDRDAVSAQGPSADADEETVTAAILLQAMHQVTREYGEM
ncbi:hypothetical protein HIM_09930 [Hirsutella minnesotensis 3608]|uniref:non-specific serine/threonine protein kinase n=1 Tax=Hirsutella minnesotensis 3608 TaxID=1043627 RepID=A0A0F7ZXG0_9HYPO|nr:hypothetical protein HIM_09930 [Hirsutella minnesotensis 3608]